MSELKSHKVTMLGTGLIGMFYTMTLHNQRGADRVHAVYSRREERATTFAERVGTSRTQQPIWQKPSTILRRILSSLDCPITCT